MITDELTNYVYYTLDFMSEAIQLNDLRTVYEEIDGDSNFASVPVD